MTTHLNDLTQRLDDLDRLTDESDVTDLVISNLWRHGDPSVLFLR